MVGDLLPPYQLALAVIEFRLHGQLHLLLWLTGKEDIAIFNCILQCLSRVIDQANPLNMKAIVDDVAAGGLQILLVAEVYSLSPEKNQRMIAHRRENLGPLILHI